MTDGTPRVCRLARSAAPPVAMAGVLGFAACGGEDAAEDARTEARIASRGSDTHLYNQAEQLERSAIARASAEAGQAELDAKLEGSPKTYGASSVNAESEQPSSSDDEFVPGTRHMPLR